MAQKVQVLLVDDLDGSEATETVAFGLDGASYEIDLSSGNAGKLRKELPTMWSTRAKRALRQGAAGPALAPAASAAPKSGSGRSSAVTRSMSAGAFPPTSSRSTKPRTSTHEPEFAGFSVLPGVHRLCRWGGGAPRGIVGPSAGRMANDSRSSGVCMERRCLCGLCAGSSCDGGGAGRIAPLARRDGLTVRGPTVRLLIRGTPRRPVSARRVPEAGRLPGGPGRAAGPGRPGPGAAGVSMSAVRLRRTRGCPGNMGLIYRVDEDERLVSRERLVMRGAYSY